MLPFLRLQRRRPHPLHSPGLQQLWVPDPEGPRLPRLLGVPRGGRGGGRRRGLLGGLPGAEEVEVLQGQGPRVVVVQGYEEGADVAVEAVRTAASAEFRIVQVTRLVRVKDTEGHADAPELLVRPTLELHDGVVGRLVQLLQGDVPGEVLVQRPPGPGDVTFEADELGAALNLLPAGAVAAVLVDVAPTFEVVLEVLQNRLLEVCGGRGVLFDSQVGGWPPDLEEVQILGQNVVLAFIVQTLEKAFLAAPESSLCEGTKEFPFLQPLLVVLVKGFEGSLDATKLAHHKGSE
mmetsp:Transcript_4466/g.13037  ORF Transcript_4466/g.13037 Transcript_4466/m.13037 type:complete len:291 (+) Transcript_4466:1569-2441(+)